MFRAFLGQRFASPGAAFRELAGGDAAMLDAAAFAEALTDLGYSGSAQRLFLALSDDRGFVSLASFEARLARCAREPTGAPALASRLPPSKQRLDFAQVVELARAMRDRDKLVGRGAAQDSVLDPERRPPRIATSGNKKSRSAAQRSILELRRFRAFVGPPLFKTPDAAFNYFVGAGDGSAEEVAFAGRLMLLKYSGDADRVFPLLAAGQPLLTREAFKARLAEDEETPRKSQLASGNSQVPSSLKQACAEGGQSSHRSGGSSCSRSRRPSVTFADDAPKRRPSVPDSRSGSSVPRVAG